MVNFQNIPRATFCAYTIQVSSIVILRYFRSVIAVTMTSFSTTRHAPLQGLTWLLYFLQITDNLPDRDVSVSLHCLRIGHLIGSQEMLFEYVIESKENKNKTFPF